MVDQADARGLPAADPRVERAARVVTALATAWVASVALRGIAGPLGVGLAGLPASLGVAADNTWHFHLLAPVTHYSASAPAATEYAWQRPLGPFFLSALVVKLGGTSALALRLPAALGCLAIPPLLHAVSRALFGPVSAALAALTFAALPVIAAYANCDAAATLAVAGVLACAWGYLRMQQTWRRRWLAVTLAGLAVAVTSDWCAYAFMAVMLGSSLVRRIAPLRRYFPPVDARRFAEWWALAGGLTILAFLAHAALLHKAGALPSFLTGALERMRASAVPSAAELLRRDYWQAVSLTPLAIWIGWLALPLTLGRVLLARREPELIVLAVLAMAVADHRWVSPSDGVRVFWPFYFAPAFALGLGVFAATALDAARWLARRLGRRPSSLTVPSAIFGVLLAAPLLIAVEGRAAAGAARHLALRAGSDGLLLDRAPERTAALLWLRGRTAGPTTVALGAGLGRELSDAWNVGQPIVGKKGRSSAGFTLLDSRAAKSTQLTELARSAAVDVAGPFWLVDHGAPRALLEGYVFERRVPGLLEGYFRLPDEPALELRKDAWLTWELRAHFAQTPNPPPDGLAHTREQRRVAFNIAVESGETGIADQLESELLAELDRSAAVAYDDGVTLLGQTLDAGPAPRLTLYFKAPGPMQGELEFRLREVMERAPVLSGLPVDARERRVAGAFPLAPELWRRGFIYALSAELRRRGGRVRFYGYWHSRKSEPLPVPVEGPPQRVLLTLE